MHRLTCTAPGCTARQPARYTTLEDAEKVAPADGWAVGPALCPRHHA